MGYGARFSMANGHFLRVYNSAYNIYTVPTHKTLCLKPNRGHYIHSAERILSVFIYIYTLYNI